MNYGEIDGWSYEYFDLNSEASDLPGFESLFRLWRDKRQEMSVPSWDDFDFYDFVGWHGRINVLDISHNPFDFRYRIAGSRIEQLYDVSLTNKTAQDLCDYRIEPVQSNEFYRFACENMYISRVKGPENSKRRIRSDFESVFFPLSKDGQRANQLFEAVLTF